MRKEGISLQIKQATKLRRFVYFRFFFRGEEAPRKAEIRHHSVVTQSFEVVGFAEGRGNFTIEALFRDNAFPEDGEVVVVVGKRKLTFPLGKLMAEAEAKERNPAPHASFREFLEGKSFTLLDLGGRDRSKVDYRKTFPGCEVTVFDILDGDNVDVVGDAHELSRYFPADSFDAVFSMAVFEHLLMPWKVVVEINRVLKVGGVGYVATHQSLGMHDRPWDFWRYSDTVWNALFNRHTGFEILGKEVTSPNFVLPGIYREQMKEAENVKGFETSSVFFRKTGETTLDWPVPLGDVVEDLYPE